MPKQIRWGILSTANIAVKRFIPGAARSRNGVVAAIASRDLRRARDVAESLAIPRAYGSYQELLDDPEVDAIYNALPNSLHAEWTIKAAAAGKPVLCEKPLALDADQAQGMIDSCRSLGVLLMEAFMYRFHPQHARVVELIENGAVGELRFVRSAFTFMLEPFPAGNVRLSSELGGGALMDVGCYCVNASRMLFGEEPSWASAQWDLRSEFGVEVSLAAILGFQGGRTAIFDCGFRAPGQGTYTAVGTRGQIEVPNAFVPPATEVTIRVTSGAELREEQIKGVDQYQLEAEEFAEALLTGRPLRIGADDALGTLRAIAALHRSASEGGVREPVA
ncbi:MAG: Gfo/Idh/MocA family oxidoreductase [Candidatus Dormiibacterota bacterium]